MNEIILSHVGNIVTADSRDVADNFEKEHKNVLQTIQNLVAENSAAKSMFMESEYESRGKAYLCYLITRDGFSLLVMGFTGKEALSWKLKYIQAFNELESRQQSKPMSALDLMSMQLEIAREHEAKINVLESKTHRLESKVEHIADAMTCASSELWNADMNHRINGLCQMYGLNYQTYRGDLYIRLESVARCNLSARKARLQERMGAAGHKYKEIKAVTKLQVIADDPKLRAIFEGIVRTEQVKYSARESA